MTASRTLVIDLRATAPVWRIPERLEQELVDGALPGWQVRVVRTDTISDGDGGHPPTAESLAAIADAEVYFGFGVTRQHVAAAGKLRWVHTSTAGVGSTLFAEMRASDILLTNSAGVHAIPMAEYALAGMLHFWRGFDMSEPARATGTWAREAFIAGDSPLREVGENSVVIVGTGGIGSALALRLTALGATCIGVRRQAGLGVPAGFARVVSLDALDAVLPGSDALVLAAPLTPLTRGLLDARRLSLLPRHALVVNVARGALVDEEALVRHLSAGLLRGAVLDVFGQEPLASASPLWQLRSALVTPHISAVTPRRFWEREGALFRENWERYAAGRPLINVVDKDAGY